ncbi:MAG: dockerin type I repeat-containing protein [Candidatus Binatia bacterium]
MAFQRNNLVFESHPGYPSGTYVSEDGTETASVTAIRGTQAQHTKETFKHDSKLAGASNSPVIDFEEIPIDMALAEEIENQMTSLSGGFQGIDFSSLEGIELTLSPAAQKGGDGTFTCVGFVEFAAEQAGHNSGQGFVRNVFESFPYLDVSVFPPELRTLPLLSPQLLNYSMKGAANINSILQWFQGLLDPVDFIITDPLGRRLGHSFQLGEINEIPKAFFSGDGELEQFLIPNPVAGTYTIELIGLGDQVAGAVASSLQEKGINEFLADGETDTFTFEIALVVGGPGDVNRDGLIDLQDVDELNMHLDTFTNDPNDPGDINGDGLLSNVDVALLEELISGRSVRKVEIDIKPGSDNNPINLTSTVIPVAILTTSVASGDEMDFDAAQVVASSLSLSGAASLAKGMSGNFGSLEDVDGDGDQDLVVQFPTAELQLNEVDNKLVLEGETLDGTAIMGMDFIEVMPAE